MPASTKVATTAGSSLAISAVLPAAITPSAYAALTYTPIKEATDLGAIGRTYNVVNHSPVDDRGVVKIKGSFDDGTMTIQLGWAPGDPGQALVETALDDDDFYAFCLTHQNGTKKYFQAQVTSAPVNFGGVDTVTGTTVNLAIKSGTIKTVNPA